MKTLTLNIKFDPTPKFPLKPYRSHFDGVDIDTHASKGHSRYDRVLVLDKNIDDYPLSMMVGSFIPRYYDLYSLHNLMSDSFHPKVLESIISKTFPLIKPRAEGFFSFGPNPYRLKKTTVHF